MLKYFGKRIEVLLFFGIIFIVISPWLFTRSIGLIDFSKTGDIGSTIGGITSPITGIIGALLIYYALVAQRQANKIQSENNTIQSLLSLLFDLESKCDNLIFFPDEGDIRKGIAAFNSIASMGYFDRIKAYMGEKTDRYKNELTAVVNFGNYLNIINSAELVYDFINISDIEQVNKDILRKKFNHIYVVYLERSLRRLSEFYLSENEENVKKDKFMIEIVNFWKKLNKRESQLSKIVFDG